MGMLLPGTTIEVSSYDNGSAENVLGNIFSAGGIVLSQMSILTGLEAHTVQNWVKRGFLSPPQHRQYSRGQFSRVVMINLLKDCMKIDQIVQLLTYINGKMDRDDDDLVEDSRLYSLFVDALSKLRGGFPTREAVKEACSSVLENFEEKIPQSLERIRTVLAVMVYAWYSTLAKQQTEILMRDTM